VKKLTSNVKMEPGSFQTERFKSVKNLAPNMNRRTKLVSIHQSNLMKLPEMKNERLDELLVVVSESVSHFLV